MRLAVGATLGAAALVAYLLFVGIGTVVQRLTAIALATVAAVAVLVVLEGAADGIGVWASVRPLGEGLTPAQGVQFALAGDFFDTLSPAGPVSSEPIVAQFVGVTTGTSYSEALGVRAVAKYVKSGTQLLVSTGLAVVLLGGPMPAAATSVVAVVVGAAALLLVGGAVLLRHHALAGRALVAALAPVLARVPRVGCDREATARAVERFGSRALLFRSAPGLVALIAVGGLLEQVLSAAALYVALGAVGVPVPALPLLALVPFPQAASLVPVPGSVGAYDGAMSGGLVLVAGVPAAAALAAVLVVRTVSVPFALAAGGVSAAFLRGWRPGA